MLLIIAVVLAFLAASLGLRALVLPRMTAGTALRRVGDYGYARSAGAALAPAAPLPLRLLGLVRRVTPAGYEERVAMLFVRAGHYDAAPERILVTAFAPPAAAVLLALFLLVGGPGLMQLVLAGAIVALGFRLPLLVLSRRVSARALRMNLDLPDFLELLAITVEAGLGFEAAIQATITRLHGPVREELGLMLQEVRMGVVREDALARMAERCDARNLQVFVRSIVQGQALGVPLGHILRTLCDDMRIRRRQAAEERAQKAPVKMIFPTALFILPSLMLVLLGPAFFRLLDLFHH